MRLVGTPKIYTTTGLGREAPPGWCIYKLLYFTAVCIYTTKSSTPAISLFFLGPNPVVVYIFGVPKQSAVRAPCMSRMHAGCVCVLSEWGTHVQHVPWRIASYDTHGFFPNFSRPKPGGGVHLWGPYQKDLYPVKITCVKLFVGDGLPK